MRIHRGGLFADYLQEKYEVLLDHQASKPTEADLYSFRYALYLPAVSLQCPLEHLERLPLSLFYKIQCYFYAMKSKGNFEYQHTLEHAGPQFLALDSKEGDQDGSLEIHFAVDVCRASPSQ